MRILDLRKEAHHPPARNVIAMPYRLIGDLPTTVRSRLPEHAQEIYLAAFNSAWTNYAGLDVDQREEIAHRVAWAAVKRSYRKEGTQWTKR